MLTASRALVCLILAFGLTALCHAAGPNLIQNGDFEAGTANGSITNVDGAGGIHSDGHPGNAFVLNDNGGSLDPTITQTVSGLSVGTLYQLTGDFRAYHTTRGPQTNAFSVMLDGANIVDYDLPSPLASWGTFTYDFTATASSHTIALVGERYGSDYSTSVDNVGLNAVPEPASLLAVGMGLVGLLVRRRK